MDSLTVSYKRDSFLHNLEKQVLDEERPFLCENLEPQKLFPWLQSKRILTCDDCEEIRSHTTTRRKVEKLIDIIKASGPSCLLQLRDAIKHSSPTQIYIAKRLWAQFTALRDTPENKEKLCRILQNLPLEAPPPYRKESERHQTLQQQQQQLAQFSFDSSKPPGLAQWSHDADSSFRAASPQQTDMQGLSSANGYTSPVFQSQISTSTGTFLGPVSGFHTSDFPPEYGSISQTDQLLQIAKLRESDGCLPSIFDDQSLEMENLRRKSLRASSPDGRRRNAQAQQLASRVPGEHDAGESYRGKSLVACETDDTSCYGLRGVTNRVPTEGDCTPQVPPSESIGGSPSSYYLLVPPNESFEVSGGNI